MPTATRRIRMRHRVTAALTLEDFVIDETRLPEPAEGEVLTRNLYLPMDPYLTRYLREWNGDAPDWKHGIIVGRTIAQVVASRSPRWREGDYVLGSGRWQDYDLRGESELSRIDTGKAPLSTCVGVLGASGITAWIGVTQVLALEAGQTFTVSAAAGTVGSIAGQIAKRIGARVVGIAGGAEKCRFVAEELGFDACVDHRSADLDAALQAAVPQGIDRHYENVGAPLLDPVIGCAREHARIALCGLQAHYQDDKPIALARFRELLYKGIGVQAFRLNDYRPVYRQALDQLGDWIAAGELRYRETISDGLENAPAAFLAMLRGAGIGKHLVKL